MLELTGFRCREHALEYGAKGKTGCRSCNALTIILDRYELEARKFGVKCDTHLWQDDKSCVICATRLAMREVNIKDAITIEQSPIIPLHQSLALRLSGDIMLKDLKMMVKLGSKEMLRVSRSMRYSGSAMR